MLNWVQTRYSLELENLKGVLSSETFKEVSQREDAKKTVKKVLEDRYTSGKNRRWRNCTDC